MGTTNFFGIPIPAAEQPAPQDQRSSAPQGYDPHEANQGHGEPEPSEAPPELTDWEARVAARQKDAAAKPPRRGYTVEFKDKVAREYATGAEAMDLSRKYHVATSMIYKWAKDRNLARTDLRQQGYGSRVPADTARKLLESAQNPPKSILRRPPSRRAYPGRVDYPCPWCDAVLRGHGGLIAHARGHHRREWGRVPKGVSSVEYMLQRAEIRDEQRKVQGAEPSQPQHAPDAPPVPQPEGVGVKASLTLFRNSLAAETLRKLVAYALNHPSATRDPELAEVLTLARQYSFTDQMLGGFPD